MSLLDIPDNYEVLFVHGGGSGEFSAVVFNLVAVWVEVRRRAAEKELGMIKRPYYKGYARSFERNCDWITS